MKEEIIKKIKDNTVYKNAVASGIGAEIREDDEHKDTVKVVFDRGDGVIVSGIIPFDSNEENITRELRGLYNWLTLLG